jgi:hypothetical protein
MTDTPGEWNEWRTYVLETLKDVKEEQRRQLLTAAALSEKDIVKAHQDIQFAYKRIRTLEDSADESRKETAKREQVASTLRMKYWIVTGLFSGAIALLSPLILEMIKEIIHRVRLSP